MKEATGVMVTPGVSPHLIAKAIPAKKKLCTAAIFCFAFVPRFTVSSRWISVSAIPRKSAKLVAPFVS